MMLKTQLESDSYCADGRLGLIPIGPHTKRPLAARERMQRGDETDTDSNAYLVIELHFVKVSQVGCISRVLCTP